MIADPLLDGVEPSRTDAARAYTADFFGMRQPAFLKNLQMLSDGGDGDPERFGELRDGVRAFGEPVENRPPGGVPQRVKEAGDFDLFG